MVIDYDILPEILLQSVLFLCGYYLLYQKFIFSILDPLFAYIFVLSFSSVLVLNVLHDQPKYFLHFCICHILFYFGFSLTTSLRKDKRITEKGLMLNQLKDSGILRIIFYSLFVVYFLANVVLFYTTGFALLNDDPTVAKVENFAKGFGIILKINWGIGSFLLSSVIFLILSKAKKIDIILLIIIVLFTALEGSKSALLRIFVVFAFLLNHSFFRRNNTFSGKFKWIMPLGLLSTGTIFFTVLSKENSGLDQTVFAFVRRLLYGADSVLFFYFPVNEQYFARFHFWEYPGHFFNQILSFLRLAEGREAFGNVMVMNVIHNATDTIVGPNTPFYIEGQIFFGYYGSFIYSACIGCLYALIRSYFFYSSHRSAFWFVLVCSTLQQASSLMIEVTLFVTQAFDTYFFVIPVYIIIILLFKKKLTLPRILFFNLSKLKTQTWK